MTQTWQVCDLRTMVIKLQLLIFNNAQFDRLWKQRLCDLSKIENCVNMKSYVHKIFRTIITISNVSRMEGVTQDNYDTLKLQVQVVLVKTTYRNMLTVSSQIQNQERPTHKCRRVELREKLPKSDIRYKRVNM